MRALFFVDVPHRIAGAQRSLLAALGALPAQGVDPLVVFPGEGLCVDAYRAAGLDVRVLPAPASLLTFGKKLLALGPVGRAAVLARDVIPYSVSLRALARREGADVLHFNTARGILAGGLAAKLARRPAVLHVRGAVAIEGMYWRAAQMLADRIVLVARALEGDVDARYRDRCRVVYNGVVVQPARDTAAARASLGLDGERPVFVSLSSPVPFKGLHHLVDAAAILAARGVRADWLLAGSSDDERYGSFLAARIASHGLGDDVKLLGYVADPMKLLAAADALVLPSVEREPLVYPGGETVDVRGNEGLPRSVLEAMAIGVPVVATRVAGVAEQVDDGATGLIVPPGDPAALAGALERVARDAGWRREAGARARDRVAERFSVEASAAGLSSVLKEVA